MNGYAGKIVIADLTDKTYEIRAIDPEWTKYYLGGSALGARYLYDLMPGGTPVFAPESVVGFVSGPTNERKRLWVGATPSYANRPLQAVGMTLRRAVILVRTCAKRDLTLFL